MAILDFSLFRPLLRLLPEVEIPNDGIVIPSKHKAEYTAASLLIFLAGSRLPLYHHGIGNNNTKASIAAAADHHRLGRGQQLYWNQAAYASTRGTVMVPGVLPLVLSEAAAHLLWGLHAVRRDEANRVLLHGPLRKLLGLAFSAAMGAGAAAPLGAGNAVMAALQVLLGGVTVIYLDEVLRRGYGLLPAVPLFTAANICVSLFLEAFTGVYGDLTATFAFFLLVLHLQGLHVALPPFRKTLPDGEPSELQAIYRVNLSYLACAPVLFQGLLLSNASFISEGLYVAFGGNKLVNLLGKWERSKQFGKLIPVSGMAYYLTTPPSWADAKSDPLNVCIYAVFLLMGCALVSAAWYRIRACAQRYQARLLGYPVRLTPVQPETIHFDQWTRHVIRTAFSVGFCVGALTLLAGFMGVIGSGTGIMLAVTIIHSNSNLDSIASRTGLFGL